MSSAGSKVYRCSPEQVKTVTVEQEALLRLFPANLHVCRSRLRERGAGNAVPVDGREVPPVQEQAWDASQQESYESPRTCSYGCG